MSKKYDHISFSVPESVRRAARRGLELRRKQSPSNKAGLDPMEAAKEGIGSGVRVPRDRGRSVRVPSCLSQQARVCVRATLIC